MIQTLASTIEPNYRTFPASSYPSRRKRSTSAPSAWRTTDERSSDKTTLSFSRNSLHRLPRPSSLIIWTVAPAAFRRTFSLLRSPKHSRVWNQILLSTSFHSSWPRVTDESRRAIVSIPSAPDSLISYAAPVVFSSNNFNTCSA